jgi:putative hydrolase
VDPLAALQRITYLLEIDNAPPFKVQAFRRAAETVRTTDPEVLARLAVPSRLATLANIGDTTARVIAEALTGEVPSYLAALEEKAGSGDGAQVLALRALLRGDCHSHSDWSDGKNPIAEMAAAARDLGHEFFTLTDHSPSLTIAHGLDAGRLRRQLELVAELNASLAPFRILTGIEVDILADGVLDQQEELLGELDVVVASCHSNLREERASMTKRLVRAVSDRNVDILGHATNRLIAGRRRPQSEFDPEEVFGACAAAGTAVEINCRPERDDPPSELLEIAVRAGCAFSIDSDAHRPGELEWLARGCRKAVAAEIAPQRILTTRSADELVAWTAAHGGAPRAT